MKYCPCNDPDYTRCINSYCTIILGKESDLENHCLILGKGSKLENKFCLTWPFGWLIKFYGFKSLCVLDEWRYSGSAREEREGKKRLCQSFPPGRSMRRIRGAITT